MRWQEIYETLKNYEEENRKGYYSYTWCNGNIPIARKSDSTCYYLLWLNGRMWKEIITPTKDNPEVFYHEMDINTRYAEVEDLPEADDYYIYNPVEYPYVAMINISQKDIQLLDSSILKNNQYYLASEINEKHINQRALNNIKAYINIQDHIDYMKRYNLFNCQSDDVKNQYSGHKCDWCGIGNNEYGEACFYFDNAEFDICTNRVLRHENQNRRHFHEQEYLFPWKSNNYNVYETLYVRSSSLVKYTGNALKEVKQKREDYLKFILNNSGINDYKITEIKRTYKYQNI